MQVSKREQGRRAPLLAWNKPKGSSWHLGPLGSASPMPCSCGSLSCAHVCCSTCVPEKLAPGPGFKATLRLSVDLSRVCARVFKNKGGCVVLLTCQPFWKCPMVFSGLQSVHVANRSPRHCSLRLAATLLPAPLPP